LLPGMTGATSCDLGTTGIWHGGMPEWLKGTDCKSVGLAYVGSNPTPSTTPKLVMSVLLRRLRERSARRTFEEDGSTECQFPVPEGASSALNRMQHAGVAQW
jgi:hypothetical protein